MPKSLAYVQADLQEKFSFFKRQYSDMESENGDRKKKKTFPQTANAFLVDITESFDLKSNLFEKH